ncbi:MAG: hypothetical protein H0U10_16475 [Chloroflexia bacterium]|nr:hypothetical protein [Chloroflexia bacterium]
MIVVDASVAAKWVLRDEERADAAAALLAATLDADEVLIAPPLLPFEIADCDLWTDDRRLVRQVGDQFPALRWIGDYWP